MSAFAFTYDQIDYIFRAANREGLLKRKWLKLNEDDEKNEMNCMYVELVHKRKNLKKEISMNLQVQAKDIGKYEEDNEKLKAEYSESWNDFIYIESKIKEEILHNILQRTFRIHVNKNFNENMGKDIFMVDNINSTSLQSKKEQTTERDSFFACKMISDDLQKCYNIHQLDRNSILSNVRLLLADPVDKILIRTDVHNFFESISQKKLLEKLYKDGLVSSKSLFLLEKMFECLKNEYQFNDGIPRGLSFSPALSNLYLRKIDELIQRLDGVYYYGRYVDDIIIIASPSNETPTAKVLFEKVQSIFKDYKLELHGENDAEEDKSKYLVKDIRYSKKNKNDIDDSIENSDQFSFNYLGYCITVHPKDASVEFHLTTHKVEQYRERIDKALAYYCKFAACRCRQKENCIKRQQQPFYKFKRILTFLTCNYHMGGTKGNLLSGIYYTHSFLTDTHQLVELDEYLRNEVEKKITDEIFRSMNLPKDFCKNLKTRICNRYSFEKGFTEKRMKHLSSSNFKIIDYILRYEKKEDKIL